MPEILLGRAAVSCNGHNALKERFVLLNSLINSKSSSNILHNRTGIYRESLGRNLSAGNSLDKLLLTALRIFLL